LGYFLMILVGCDMGQNLGRGGAAIIPQSARVWQLRD
jgi:hypothetical protein